MRIIALALRIESDEITLNAATMQTPMTTIVMFHHIHRPNRSIAGLMGGGVVQPEALDWVDKMKCDRRHASAERAARPFS